MNEPRNKNELLDLLDALCNDKLAPDDRRQLELILAENVEARRVYFDYLDMHLQLRRWRKAEGRRADGVELQAQASPFLSSVPDSAVDTAAELPHSSFPSLFPLPSPLSPQFVDRPVFSYMVASVVLCIMLLSAWAYKITNHQIANVPSPLIQSNNNSEFVFVGRITGMVDVKWSDDPRYLPPMAFANVLLGRKYFLDAGLLEITYHSGAKVILEGPCEYTVDSDAGGFLKLGKLTARVEKKVVSGQWLVASDERSETRDWVAKLEPLATSHQPLTIKNSPRSSLPPPLFSIRTPTVVVTDLGTEFGVEVKQDGELDIHVFDGMVEVARLGENHNAAAKTRMAAGEALRFGLARIEPQIIPFRATRITPDSMRSISNARKSRLLKPVGLVATAYHRILDTDGNLLAMQGRLPAFRVTTDGVFGRGENNEGPRSSFDTQTDDRSKTAFVGLLYGRRVRIDRIKVFLGRQFDDGGGWREIPRVFILKNPVDPGDTPPETDPANWRELPPLGESYGRFDAKTGVNPGEVFEFTLLDRPESDVTGYGWAVGGVMGNGEKAFVSVTELRAYGEDTKE